MYDRHYQFCCVDASIKKYKSSPPLPITNFKDKLNVQRGRSLRFEDGHKNNDGTKPVALPRKCKSITHHGHPTASRSKSDAPNPNLERNLKIMGQNTTHLQKNSGKVVYDGQGEIKLVI